MESRLPALCLAVLFVASFSMPVFGATPTAAPATPNASNTTNTTTHGPSTSSGSQFGTGSGFPWASNNSSNASVAAGSNGPISTPNGPQNPHVNVKAGNGGVSVGAGFNPVNGWMKDFEKGAVNFSRGVAKTTVKIVVNRPIPKRNGHIELVKQPTNEPLKGAYQLWHDKVLPISLVLWAFTMLMLQFDWLLPRKARAAASAKNLQWKGWINLFLIAGSWTISAGILALSGTLAETIAPSGKQLVGSFTNILASAGAAGAGAYLLYLSSGVLFLVILFAFIGTWLMAIYLAAFSPLCIALSTMDIGWAKFFAGFGKKMMNFFMTCSFFTVPTSCILLAGYALNDSIMAFFKGWLVIPGIPVSAVVILATWALALTLPIYLFWGRSLTGVATMAVGAMAARSIPSVRDRFSSGKVTTKESAGVAASSGAMSMSGAGDKHAGLPPGVANPSEGSPFDSAAPLGATAISSNPPSGLSGGATDRGTNTSTSTSRSTTATSEEGERPNYYENVSESEITKVNASPELPETQNYSFGVQSSNGNIQTQSAEMTHERVTGGMLERINDARDGRILAFGNDDDEFYDVSNLYRESPADQFNSGARDDVYGTWGDL